MTVLPLFFALEQRFFSLWKFFFFYAFFFFKGKKTED